MKKSNSGEIIVRILCFALGVLLTVSAVLIRDRFFTGAKNSVESEVTDTEVTEEKQEEVKKVEAVISPIALIDDENTIGDSHVEVAELEKYEEEVTQKIAELKEQPTLTENDDVSYTDELASNMNGKKSKLNWKPYYTAYSKDNKVSLEERQANRSSYEETLAVNAFDKKVIEESKINFNGVKITIMGDSLTAASNMTDEDAAKYNYPKILSEILGCEVVNMGIGGSTVSSCANNDPMIKRWQSIPEDSDIVIIFGGTNDCLFENRWQYGNLEYDLRMNENTFCGDLDSMCSGMKWKFHDNIEDRYVRMIYINPPSTILNDGVVAVDPGNMVPQSEFAKAINEIAPNYGFDVIDFYNTNILNSHDYDINREFMPDGVHGNVAGYQIMAEHIASEIIQMIEQD